MSLVIQVGCQRAATIGTRAIANHERSRARCDPGSYSEAGLLARYVLPRRAATEHPRSRSVNHGPAFDKKGLGNEVRITYVPILLNLEKVEAKV